MSRKQKNPPSKPSKAYLVSFGDTMTALLAFFIVINSLAKEQTGAKMYSGTGSFVAAIKSVGVPGLKYGDRSSHVVDMEAPTPLYAFDDRDNKMEKEQSIGPDDHDDGQRVLDRQAENFQRFLNELDRKFPIEEDAATKDQVVFDSFEKFGDGDDLMGNAAIQSASDVISQLENPEFDMEIVVWANMPSPTSIGRAMDQAIQIQKQIDKSFFLNKSQKRRMRVSAKPWLFADAKRPKMSFVVSRKGRPAN